MNINSALHLPPPPVNINLKTVAMMITWTCAQEAHKRCRPTGDGTGLVSIASGPGSDLGSREHMGVNTQANHKITC